MQVQPIDAAMSRGRSSRRAGGALLAALASALIAGCGGGSTPDVDNGSGGTVDGSNGFYFQDPNAGGVASDFRWSGIAYGRLVELFGRDTDGRRVLMGSDFVVGQSVVSEPGTYTLERNPVTGQELLTIEENVDTDAGRAEFLRLAQEAGDTLDTIQVRDLDDAGVYTMLPRNAAVVLTFDDLLRPEAIDSRSVQFRTGDPPTIPFEARVFASSFYGGTIAGGSDFYPTRVVIDLTTSELEAFSVDPPLPINGVGAPASLNTSAPNGQIRIPTRLNQAIGITEILTNLAGNPMATGTNGPVDFADATRPVTRAFRTGGRSDIIADPFNGFLEDQAAPIIVGSTPITVLDAPQQVDGLRYVLPRVEFASQLCSSPPEVGDIIVQSGLFAEVERANTQPVAGIVTNLEVRLLLFPSSWPGPQEWENVGVGSASYETAFDAAIDGARPNCFLTVVPQPNGFPDDPTGRVKTDSVFSLRFSEPMDPASLTAFDSVTLTRTSFDPDVPTATSSFVVGSVFQTADLSGVTFTPQQLLAHTQGLSEPYFLRVADSDNDVFPPRDLAGNVVERIPEINISVEPTELSALNGGRVSRFTSIDEELPEGAEFGGQVLIDTTRQLLRPRPVVRNQVIIDNSQPIMQQMTFLPGGLGVITPHTPFGSKLQHIWRYADCSFALLDQLDHNVDVEGLAWAPNGGTIQPDAFDQFEIRLAHSRWTPDEDINPSNAWPRFPFSGLDDIYLNNIVASVPSDLPAQVTVHDRSLGYNLDPGDLETASTGTTFMPFPLNRDIPQEQRRYFTWRDCDNRARGGGGNAPVDPRAYWISLGIDPGSQPVVYSPGQVQTVGLPLLMEYRVIPDATAIGINGWDFNIAVNSSSRPYFRSFSSGGINQSGTTVTVNPDQESTASGGFAPGSNPPGAITPGQDNVVHLGALDLITRVSHSNSIWFTPDIVGEDGDLPFPGRVYQEPTIEPSLDDQPAGTELIVRFRGATSITYDNSETPGVDNDAEDPNPDELTDYQVDAFTLDCYGDYYNDLDFPVSHNGNRDNPGLNFVGADDFWRDSVDEIRDARFYQVRLTFVGNPENGQSAEVSAFALTWSQP